MKENVDDEGTSGPDACRGNSQGVTQNSKAGLWSLQSLTWMFHLGYFEALNISLLIGSKYAMQIARQITKPFSCLLKRTESTSYHWLVVFQSIGPSVHHED